VAPPSLPPTIDGGALLVIFTASASWRVSPALLTWALSPIPNRQRFPKSVVFCRAKCSGDKMQDLEKMAAKLLETARKLPPGAGRAMNVENDTEVFYEVRVEPLTGEHIYTDRTGTRAAIHKSGRKLDPMSRYFCPHQWLDADGFVSQELADQYPHPHRS
jgi:hypothetical protein